MTRIGGVVAILSGLPFDWFNQVLVEREDATPADLLVAANPGARAGLTRSSSACATGSMTGSSGPWPMRGWCPRGEATTTPGMAAFPIDDNPAPRDPRRPTSRSAGSPTPPASTCIAGSRRRGSASDPVLGLGNMCPEPARSTRMRHLRRLRGREPRSSSGLGWRNGPHDRRLQHRDRRVGAPARVRRRDDGPRGGRRSVWRLRRRRTPGERDGSPDLRATGLPDRRQVRRLRSVRPARLRQEAVHRPVPR